MDSNLPPVATPSPSASGSAASPSSRPAANPADSAAHLAAKHGGKASRRRPGSPEAIEADRAKDRERKRRKALEMRGEPVPLPSPLVVQPAAGDAPPPASDFGAVPWTADLLRPIFEQALPVAEGLAVQNLTEKARAAKLDAALVREVADGAKIHPLAKQQIVEGGAAVAAKYLNKSGVSSEHADEVRLLGGIVAAFAGYRAVAAKLDELAGKAPPPPPPAPPAKEAPAHAPS
jgi:hypothetical protein